MLVGWLPPPSGCTLASQRGETVAVVVTNRPRTTSLNEGKDAALRTQHRLLHTAVRRGWRSRPLSASRSRLLRDLARAPAPPPARTSCRPAMPRRAASTTAGRRTASHRNVTAYGTPCAPISGGLIARAAANSQSTPANADRRLDVHAAERRDAHHQPSTSPPRSIRLGGDAFNFWGVGLYDDTGAYLWGGGATSYYHVGTGSGAYVPMRRQQPHAISVGVLVRQRRRLHDREQRRAGSELSPVHALPCMALE